MTSEQDVLDLPLDSSTDGADEAKVEKAAPAPAEPSTAADAESAEDRELLSVVRDVVQKKADPAVTEASSADAAEPETEPAGEKSPTVKPDDENFSDVPFHRHPRFRQLLGRMKAAETDAVRYRNIETFLTDNGLAAEEAAEALVVAGLTKTNPVAAWERVLPWVQQLAVAAGVAVPQDLRQRVQAGELTEAGAAEIAKLQAQQRSFQAQQQLVEMQRQQRQQMEAQQALINEASAWEIDRHRKDPNFEAKMPALQKELLWLQSQEGRPTTPQGVRDQLNRAYKAISGQPANAAPKPAIRPVTSGNTVPPAPAAAPKSDNTLDIIKQIATRR